MHVDLFHSQPGGRIRLQVCTDVACKLRGATVYLNGLCSELGIQPGGTTADARWIPLAERRSITWTANWRDALDQLLP